MPDRLANRYSARSLLADAQLGGRNVVFASLHGTPGTGACEGKRVGEFKPFFHGGSALEFAPLRRPFLFGIDANEPRSETLEESVFHWKSGRPGALKFEALLGRSPHHKARDLAREQLRSSGMKAKNVEYLELTHQVPSGGRRFDSIWATNEFKLHKLTTKYKEAIRAGSDHAILLAEVTI